MNVVSLNDWVIYERDDGVSCLTQANRFNEIKIGKQRAWADELLGHAYGSVLIMRPFTAEEVEQQKKASDGQKVRPQELSKKNLKYNKLVKATGDYSFGLNELNQMKNDKTAQDEAVEEDGEEEAAFSSSEEEDSVVEFESNNNNNSNKSSKRPKINDKDNRFIMDSNANQKLSQAQIEVLKSEGVSGEAIIHALTSNSETFGLKTAFSQEKYLKKLSKKWLPKIKLIKPNTRTLSECLFEKNPPSAKEDRYRLMRWCDSLPQMFSFGNVHASSKTLVLDGIGGLLVMGVCDRVRGEFGGRCYSIVTSKGSYQEGQMRVRCVEMLNLGRREIAKRLVLVPSLLLINHQGKTHFKTMDEKESDYQTLKTIREINNCNNNNNTATTTSSSSSSSSSRKPVSNPESALKEDDVADIEKIQLQNYKEMKDCLLGINDNKESKTGGGGADGLLIATRHNLLDAVDLLFPCLGRGMPFAIHSPHIEPLIQVRKMLETKKMAIDLAIIEAFFRELQVLPSRTHPEVSGKEAGGFVLKGIKSVT